ncbi:MAG: S8 family serine peptidase [Gammaproteobacteria bacterium]|nr:S8 family serine peptidase [Gammaproteobacteria bacterium]
MAAGNSGSSGVSGQSSAKNVVSIGAVTDAGVVNSFSSHGPTADGRLNPHVVGTGSAVQSARGNARRGGYWRASGTSMAAPSVAGLPRAPRLRQGTSDGERGQAGGDPRLGGLPRGQHRRARGVQPRVRAGPGIRRNGLGRRSRRRLVAWRRPRHGGGRRGLRIRARSAGRHGAPGRRADVDRTAHRAHLAHDCGSGSGSLPGPGRRLRGSRLRRTRVDFARRQRRMGGCPITAGGNLHAAHRGGERIRGSRAHGYRLDGGRDHRHAGVDVERGEYARGHGCRRPLRNQPDRRRRRLRLRGDDASSPLRRFAIVRPVPGQAVASRQRRGAHRRHQGRSRSTNDQRDSPRRDPIGRSERGGSRRASKRRHVEPRSVLPGVLLERDRRQPRRRSRRRRRGERGARRATRERRDVDADGARGGVRRVAVRPTSCLPRPRRADGACGSHGIRHQEVLLGVPLGRRRVRRGDANLRPSQQPLVRDRRRANRTVPIVRKGC